MPLILLLLMSCCCWKFYYSFHYIAVQRFSFSHKCQKSFHHTRTTPAQQYIVMWMLSGIKHNVQCIPSMEHGVCAFLVSKQNFQTINYHLDSTRGYSVYCTLLHRECFIVGAAAHSFWKKVSDVGRSCCSSHHHRRRRRHVHCCCIVLS